MEKCTCREALTYKRVIPNLQPNSHFGKTNPRARTQALGVLTKHRPPPEGSGPSRESLRRRISPAPIRRDTSIGAQRDNPA